MRRRLSTQMPIPFEPARPAMLVPAPIAQDLVLAVADLLLASAELGRHRSDTFHRLHLRGERPTFAH